MGDRGNIVIETADKKPILYFYTHWTGSDLPNIVKRALSRRWRWDDASYLNRILFSELCHEIGETGFGIDVVKGDGDTEVYVCHELQTVRIEDKTFSFKEYITLALDEGIKP